MFDHFAKYHTAIFLGDFNAKLGKERVFSNRQSRRVYIKIENDNGARVINFVTTKNLVVKSTMFPHQNICKYTWISLDEKTHNQIDHVLTDRSLHSSIVDIRPFRERDCDTDYYLVIAKVRERLSTKKQAAQTTNVERFNLKKLSEMGVRKQFQIELSNRLAALENLNNSEDIHRAWENIKDKSKSHLKRH